MNISFLKEILDSANFSKSILNLRNLKGCTPLHAATARSDLPAMRLLLEAGSPIDVADRRGQTALYVAAKGGMQAEVELLLSSGANAKLEDQSGRTPLAAAAEGSWRQVMVALIRAENPQWTPAELLSKANEVLEATQRKRNGKS
jgi:ankyrin repeat protein